MSEDSTLHAMSLEDLVALARRRSLADGWTYDRGRILLRVGDEDVSLQTEAAKVFIRGLIRSYDNVDYGRDYS